MVVKPENKQTKGFSLVELSIVLVILGLLVGGVMSGQSLIKAAELRSVTSEFQQWQTAVNVFKDKYFALPGDMPNATAFWTAEGNCAAVQSNSHTTALSGGTCDGDGNGMVTNYNSDHYEGFLFWHHLQLAGLIPGQYTGVRTSTGTRHHSIGQNVPRAKFSNGGWSAWSHDSGSGGDRYDMDFGNYFAIGSELTGNSIAHGPLFTPEEAWNIDTKVDDGMPGKGNVIARSATVCTTSVSSTDFDGDYKLSDDSVLCSLGFLKAM